jgi:hypothetical protein
MLTKTVKKLLHAPSGAQPPRELGSRAYNPLASPPGHSVARGAEHETANNRGAPEAHNVKERIRRYECLIDRQLIINIKLLQTRIS